MTSLSRSGFARLGSFTGKRAEKADRKLSAAAVTMRLQQIRHALIKCVERALAGAAVEAADGEGAS